MTTWQRKIPACLLIAAVTATVCQGEIRNPSFEEYYRVGIRLYPLHWQATGHDAFRHYVSGTWASDGAMSANIYSRINQSVNVGDFKSLQQDVDLTQVKTIVFDVALSAHGAVAEPVFEGYEAALAINGVVLWSESEGGDYYDQEADVSHLSGVCTVELRNAAIIDQQNTLSCWTQWDNLRLVESAEIDADVQVRPNKLALWSLGRWIMACVELPEGYSVDDIDDNSVVLEIAGVDPPLSVVAACGKTSDHDEDGIPDRLFKFERPDLANLAGQLAAQEDVTVMVSGVLTDGTVFRGTDTVRVSNKKQTTTTSSKRKGKGRSAR